MAGPKGHCHVSVMTQPAPTPTLHEHTWRVGPLQVDLSRPRVMGILNVTPDSFYDGGRFNTIDGAIARAEAMISQGADIIDVGGESSRPAGPYGNGAVTVPIEEEIARTAPVIEGIAKRFDRPISIDTTKSSVARAALESGATIVNDITATNADPDVLDIVAGTGAGIVLMHMKGTPRTMQRAPSYTDLIGEITTYLDRAATKCLAAGVTTDRIVIDPGFGFGKTRAHNLQLLRRLRDLLDLGFPVLVGPSRKTFVDPEVPPENRLAGSLAAATLAVAHGARIVRTHDVAPTVKAVAIVTACLLDN